MGCEAIRSNEMVSNLPESIVAALSNNRIEIEVKKLKKAELIRAAESKSAKEDGCYCNPGSGGC